jgi:RimJ/RimL family protein N-acetyltransferase
MLRGKKVILRTLERSDLQRLQEMERNVEIEVIAAGAWYPRPFESFERSFQKYTVDDPEPSWFGIEADGNLIGLADLHHKDRFVGKAEVGITIYDPDYLGKGYGRDAMRVLCDWAFRIQGFRRLYLEVFSHNERAIRAYRACGFVEEGRLREHAYCDGQYVDMIVMGLMRDEWLASPRR